MLSATAVADIENALAAIAAKDFETAFREFKALAKAGNELAYQRAPCS